MMQQFPIFVDLHVVPPLIIGDAPALAAKLRLLRKAAPLVDVIASKKAEWRAEFATDTGVCWLAEMDRQAAKAAIKGRPLVILDCEDESLNRFLVATARAYGVPVNVPDNRALSGFYLGAIVDRAPLIIGISTSGLAPVLGQALRARLESMLPRNYGRLAHFLADLRCRLSALTPARRRRFQHDMINGPAARHVLAGHPQLAEACADAALRHETRPQDHPKITLVACGSGAAARLPAPATEAIRQADHLLYEAAIPPDVLDIARREVALTPVDDGWQVNHQHTALPAELLRRLRQQLEGGQEVVWLRAGQQAALRLQQQPGSDPLVQQLCAAGLAVNVIPAALPAPRKPGLSSGRISTPHDGAASAVWLQIGLPDAGYVAGDEPYYEVGHEPYHDPYHEVRR